MVQMRSVTHLVSGKRLFVCTLLAFADHRTNTNAEEVCLNMR